jgi:hypothetical protein
MVNVWGQGYFIPDDQRQKALELIDKLKDERMNKAVFQMRAKWSSVEETISIN